MARRLERELRKETQCEDPFKDTSSVALNPVIKFTTLFGLLAVELAVSLAGDAGIAVTFVLAAVFFAVALTFVLRSFYGMRIGSGRPEREVRPSSDLATG